MPVGTWFYSGFIGQPATFITTDLLTTFQWLSRWLSLQEALDEQQTNK